MPTGMPTPEQLWNGDVSFFSIDTDVIQSQGYNFEAGALNQLHRQLPSTMNLQLTDVVANEIIKHRMESVLKNIQQLEAASTNLKRLAELPMDGLISNFEGLSAEVTARAFFRNQIENYAATCRGGVLPTQGEGIIDELFRRYFNTSAPFGLKTDKKSEFPDATSLLLLEAFAAATDSMGIVVSMDGGWEAFAAQSDLLYCAKSLDELTALFIATGEVATQIQSLMNEAIEDYDSSLHTQLSDALREHVIGAAWDVGDIYSDTGSRVEGEVCEYILISYELDPDSTSVWNNQGDPNTWLVEVMARVMVNVETSVTTYLWDSIDRDELAIDSDSVNTDVEIEVTAFLTCTEVQAGSPPSDWDVEVEIAPGTYVVDVGEVATFPEEL
ncbi:MULTISPECIES: PIN domain-containing protein [unclassified Pseudomonas]|uniref:PIN domain-containing protein n=1 Tax=unclassified Pseudomonas TaxID=196821 RepID=UPI0012FE470F|nr:MULTISPECIES: PIN domain-containing protein [unclassified Pseudomonas]MCU1740050.1 PIN domain-containing protein [Pseudomonas sp. 20S_6.2_Bac1]